MKIDQTKKSPFFEFLDNETDAELSDFTSARQVDTEQVKSAVKRKIVELDMVLEICKKIEEKGK